MAQNDQHEKPSVDSKLEFMHARYLVIEAIQNTILIDVFSKTPEPLKTSSAYNKMATKALKVLLEGHTGTPSLEQKNAYMSAMKVLADRFRFVDSNLQ